MPKNHPTNDFLGPFITGSTLCHRYEGNTIIVPAAGCGPVIIPPSFTNSVALTFSTLSLENAKLWESGQGLRAVIHLTLHLSGGVFLAIVGLSLGAILGRKS